MSEKILISGTGRCGTTFLIILLSMLKLDTGYNVHNFRNHIFENCNSGMEQLINCKNKIIKNPVFIEKIENIVSNNNIKIKYMIIPIRDYSKSANSRLNLGNENGGLWNATDFDSQINFYYKIMANYNYTMVKYDIPTIFLDFDKMINDTLYLYNKLLPILENKSYKEFINAFNAASFHQNKEFREKLLNKKDNENNNF